MEHVIKPLIFPGALQGEDIQRFRHDAYLGAVPTLTAADDAGVRVGDVMAGGAQDDLLLYGEDGLGEGTCFLRGHADQVVGEPLGGLGADAGQLVELLDEPGYRLGGGHKIGAQIRPPVFTLLTCSGI